MSKRSRIVEKSVRSEHLFLVLKDTKKLLHPGCKQMCTSAYIYFASTVLCTQKVVCSNNLFSRVVFHELFKNQLQIEKSDVDLDQKLGFRASIDRFPGDLRFSTGDSRYGTAIGRETAGNDGLDSLRSSSVKFSVRGHPKTQLDAVCSMMVSQKTSGIASSLCSNGRVGLRE